MSLAPAHHQQHPITTIENNIAYPFRLRHSYGQQQALATHGGSSGRMFGAGFSRPGSAVFSGSDSSSPVSPAEEYDDLTVPRFPAAAHLPHLPHDAEEGFSHASSPTGTASLNSHHFHHSNGTDFPIIPSRPPLRPTVSFGGVSGMSYYSTRSSEHDRELETRSLSLARAEQEAAGVRAKAASLTNLSLRKARSLACVWPEGRKKGR